MATLVHQISTSCSPLIMCCVLQYLQYIIYVLYEGQMQVVHAVLITLIIGLVI